MKYQNYDEITSYLSVIQGQIYEKINLYVSGIFHEIRFSHPPGLPAPRKREYHR